jgi:DtxR family Mn-dependent transcriptional regulator
MPEEATVEISGVPEHTSESEEMYLLTLAVAEEDGRSGPHPVSALAGALGVSVASAHEMIRKLVARDLAAYEPYRGVDLTPAGRAVATRVLRTRRLWATFLVERLDLSPGEADDLACHLEHVTPPDAAERLAAFLGDPAAGPLGKAIPPAAGGPSPDVGMPLGEAPAGRPLVVVVVNAEEGTAGFLASQGISAGATLTIEGRGRTALLVEAGGPVSLTAHLAAQIRVREAGGG